jgi:hypothetical protein
MSDLINHVNWDIRQPLSKARFVEDFNEWVETKIPSDVLNIKMGIKKNDHVKILSAGSQMLLTEPIDGNTFGSILKALDRGLNRKLNSKDSDDVQLAYGEIANYRKHLRMGLVQMFESNHMRVRDLIGDHNALAGHWTQTDGVWNYTLDS